MQHYCRINYDNNNITSRYFSTQLLLWLYFAISYTLVYCQPQHFSQFNGKNLSFSQQQFLFIQIEELR